MIAESRVMRDVLNLADEIVNNPAMQEVSMYARREIGLVNDHQILALRRQLALAYAQGYIRGRNSGRRHEVVPPPPPAILRS